MNLTQERMRQLLDYNPETGDFTWLKCTGRRVVHGERAGWPDDRGYIKIGIDGRKYFAHRLVWLHVFGRWPTAVIDHINHVRHDNRIANLRDVSIIDNCRNSSARTKRKTFAISSFRCPRKAYLAYCEAAISRFGDKAVLCAESS